MRRSITIGAIVVVVLSVAGWYLASPLFAVAALRNAAVRGDTQDLADRIDFAQLREGVRGQISQIAMKGTQEHLRDNPFAALGAVLAMKMVDAMVDAMLTPAAIAAFASSSGEQKPENVSAWELMRSQDIAVQRHGFSRFDVILSREPERVPVLRFSRDGLTWRLVGLQFPKEVLTRQARNVSKEPTPAAPEPPKWEYEERKDPMDDTVTVALVRSADEEVATRRTTVRPTLTLRCRAKKFELYVNVKSSVEYNYQTHRSGVRLRFDETPATREAWAVATSREALFSPDPQEHLRMLLGAKILRFEWQASSGSPIVATFSSDDLGRHASRFLAACGISDLSASKAPMYSVALGAYADADKLRELREKLTTNGIASFAESVPVRQGTLFRLRAGPFRNFEEAEEVQKKAVELGIRGSRVVSLSGSVDGIVKQGQSSREAAGTKEDLSRETTSLTVDRERARLHERLARESTQANADVMADWMAKVRAKIRGNMVLPSDVKGNSEALFDVVQLPNGEVLSVRLKKSSGNPSLDAVIERAILKSSPLPKPDSRESPPRSFVFGMPMSE